MPTFINRLVVTPIQVGILLGLAERGEVFRPKNTSYLFGDLSALTITVLPLPVKQLSGKAVPLLGSMVGVVVPESFLYFQSWIIIFLRRLHQ